MLLDDNPSLTDEFGYNKYADTLKEVILTINNTPFTIGILGPWGSGKTTMMKLIHKKLKGECKKIWFNPWKYDNKEVVWNAFIQSIFYEMKKDLKEQDKHRNKNLIENITECGKKLAWYAFKIGANKLTSGICTNEFLDELKSSFKRNEEAYNFINTFEDTFSKLVENYSDGKKVVIFIDDLDRCIPENAITILESIKLFMDNSNVIFVLGLEKEIVEKGIHFRYKKEIDFSGKDYLEKIIQLPFVIPVMNKEDVKEYITKVDIPQLLPPDQRQDRFLALIMAGTAGNIRKVKRFINCFYILKSFSGIADDNWNRHEVLGKVLLIQMCFPQFYKRLKNNSELLSTITNKISGGNHIDLTSYCENEEEQNDLFTFLKKSEDIDNAPNLVADSISLTFLSH